MTRRRMTDAERATIAALYDQHVPGNEIARRLERDSATIHRYLHRAGLHDPARPKAVGYRVPVNRLARAVHLYQEGWYTLSVIRRMTGVSAATLYDELHRRALPLRRPALSEPMRRVATERHAARREGAAR